MSSNLAATPSERAVPTLDIRPYEPRDAAAFRALNEAWITRHFILEEEDRRTLATPEEHVLAPGGHIYMAFVEGREEAVGCCALILLRPGVYELAKMAVLEELRGGGLGRRILEYVIEHARRLGVATLLLESNSALANAVHLYESVGFTHIPPERGHVSPYARADVHMEMRLSSS
jgi:GNAT superfamily N-acetyltransferase